MNMTMWFAEIDRLQQIVEQELGVSISSAVAEDVMLRVETLSKGRNQLPVWMAGYLRISRRMNRRISPQFAVHAHIISYIRHPYRKLNERAVYEDDYTLVHPLYKEAAWT